MAGFRIFLFNSLPPERLHHLLHRITSDLPGVEVCGVLQKAVSPPRGFWDWLRTVGSRAVTLVPGIASIIGHELLRWFHAAPKFPNGKVFSFNDIEVFWKTKGIVFYRTSDFQDEPSLAFARNLRPDLGVVFGDGTLEVAMLEIPRLGCITAENVAHASTFPGTPECPSERWVTVQRVRPEKPGEVLTFRTFSLEPYDTPISVDLKTTLLSIDCLTEAICRERKRNSREEVKPLPVPDLPPRGLPNPDSWRNTVPFQPTYGRPFFKLAVRLLAYPVLHMKNRLRARKKMFPVVILFHHVITDRPKVLGMSTEAFLKQVRFLKKHYHIASLPEAIEMLQNREVPAPTVVLTFDDGYEDNFLCLRTVAEAENVPVTLFVCTKKISDRGSFAHDLARGETGFHALSWDQLRELERQGFTIGSHTRNHLDCGVTNEDLLEEEIVGAHEDLLCELNHEVPFFSFPKGKVKNMSETALGIARRTYPYLFAASGGYNVPPIAPGSVLKRCNHPVTMLELELTMQSILDW